MRYGKSLTTALYCAVLALSGPAFAQGWDPQAKEFDRSATGQRNLDGGSALSPAQRNATLDQLNKILATSNLPIADRLMYLNLRAFALSRLGRDADAQKDVAEMTKVAPQAWQILMPEFQIILAAGGDRGTALKILDYGLARKPGDVSLTVGQAQIYMQLADHPRAVSLLDGAVGGSATASDRQFSLYFRGLANFNVGNFAQSSDDFDTVLTTRTTLKTRISPVLWRYAAQVRARRDAKGNLVKTVGNENLYEWPGAVAKFLLGYISAGELEVASESDENAKKANGRCVASFYMGMDAVRRGDKQQAREKFQLTQARCSTGSSYNWAASSELKRL